MIITSINKNTTESELSKINFKKRKPHLSCFYEIFYLILARRMHYPHKHLDALRIHWLLCHHYYLKTQLTLTQVYISHRRYHKVKKKRKN
ncbi:hypothetical protein BpHYR1_005411 [Brachionus plicatilis]|uniref:Uncharacterized protein n=1 Tax=Brachionus plicatilis TaxID=10195 RepID=A0A3M7PD06_BRAPC|nr:hypothetical protein BpHYR1_005411 [Brachionus plicatilis]